MPNDPLGPVREIAAIVLTFGAVILSMWFARRRLQRWQLWLAVGAAVVSVPLTITLISSARAGEWSGWGGLALLVVLLPAAFVAALSVTALLMFAILLPRYGFDARTPEERRAARAAERSPEGQRAFAVRRLKVSAAGLVVVLLMLGVSRLMR
ncbi:MAG: hypothetical protein MUF00_16540 [Gemmatimonadaceae bacterium]|jgi:hypothetical protein|nr:hypothetical protein [Gemmatimonadaceae bacterium]